MYGGVNRVPIRICIFGGESKEPKTDAETEKRKKEKSN